jgi:hypothetical protein
LAIAWPAQAQLQFRDPTPLTLARGAPAPFSLCNTAKAQVASFKVFVDGLALKDAKGASTGLILLTPADAKPGAGTVEGEPLGPLPPGNCADYALSVSPDGAAPGVYQGIVTAVAGGEPPVRLKASLNVPAPTPPVVTTLTSSLHLRADHAVLPWWGEASLEHRANVALVSKTKPDIPGCASFDSPCFVGNLTHGSDLASVFITGAPTEVPSNPAGSRPPSWVFPLSIKGATDIGDYTGTLDLGDGSKDSQPTEPVTVAVGVPDYVPQVILVLIALVGLVVYWVFQAWRPADALRKELQTAKGDYLASSQTHVVMGFPGDKPGESPGSKHEHRLTRPDKEALNTYETTALNAIDAYTGSVVLIDRSSAAWTNAKQGVTALKDDLAAWNALPKVLGSLRQQVEATLAALRAPNDRPFALSSAIAMFGPASLAVGEASVRKKSAEDATTTLSALAEKLARLNPALDQADRADQIADPSQDDSLRRTTARALLDDVHAGLWAARTADAVNSDDIEIRLQRAEDLLAHIQPPTPSENLVARISPAPALAPDLVATLASLFSPAISPAIAATIKEIRGRWFDALVALIVTAATIVIGYKALGIDDTWGTVGDYLTLVAATIVAPSAGVAGLTAANKLRLLREDPLVETAAQPASD